jgi:hypothetical protein
MRLITIVDAAMERHLSKTSLEEYGSVCPDDVNATFLLHAL